MLSMLENGSCNMHCRPDILSKSAECDNHCLNISEFLNRNTNRCARCLRLRLCASQEGLHVMMRGGRDSLACRCRIGHPAT